MNEYVICYSNLFKTILNFDNQSNKKETYLLLSFFINATLLRDTITRRI